MSDTPCIVQLPCEQKYWTLLSDIYLFITDTFCIFPRVRKIEKEGGRDQGKDFSFIHCVFINISPFFLDSLEFVLFPPTFFSLLHEREKSPREWVVVLVISHVVFFPLSFFFTIVKVKKIQDPFLYFII